MSEELKQEIVHNLLHLLWVKWYEEVSMKQFSEANEIFFNLEKYNLTSQEYFSLSEAYQF